MKKISILLITILGTLTVFSALVPTSASTCEAAPEVFSIGTNVLNISEGDSFILSVTFYNDCSHTITEVLINGQIYSIANGDITSQGYGSTFLPGGSRAYQVRIPLVYTQSMGTSFEITHFVYSTWILGLTPSSTIVVVNETFDNTSIMDPYDYDPTTNTTTVNYTITVTNSGIEVTNSEGVTESILFDSLFFAGLYVNYIGDVADFYTNPFLVTNNFIGAALDNYQVSDGFGDFVSDTVLDVIMADDGISDLVLNTALDYMIEQMQIAEPNHVFPGEYMLIDEEFVEVLIDDNGNIVIDDAGNPVINPDGNTAGEINPLWTLEPNGIIDNALEDFSGVIFNLTGHEINFVPIVEWVYNHWGFIFISIILIIFTFLTKGAWITFIPWIISAMLVIIKSILFVIKDIFGIIGSNKKTSKNKQRT